MVIFLWKCVEKFNSINDAGTPLNIAIREERWDIVKFLIQSGADLNLTDIYGTPLGLTIRKGCWDIVKLLIENGADINLTDIWNTFKYSHSGNMLGYCKMSNRKRCRRKFG
jgi:ankyrin repeat protein